MSIFPRWGKMMVRVCAFPTCGNKMTRNTPLSFHRLPLNDAKTRKSWLVVLQLDVNTPTETLRLADHRVCSDHFERDDYCQPKKARKAVPRHFFLKKDAVPRLERPITERQVTYSRTTLLLYSLPQLLTQTN